MYLALISESAREYFLELANHMMHADGEVGMEEEAILEAFRYECEMPDYQPKGIPVEQILNELAKLDQQAKNATMIELTALALADEEIHADENKLLLRTAEKLEVNEERITDMKQWVQDMNDVANRGMELIENGSVE
ncbi:TerB family tellurite resistance protein [Oceanospirillum beijerinckii]|uniref:TerB family tellurite resistance protein n=1 Tax=Oceanospirillum beijerinckii TaxID=64976 RepID=UPI0004117407|nr:TerB family tellurite resistance protein [Oceanospirillum beijerinckii]